MPTHRLPTLLWRDHAGFWTATLLEGDDACGFGTKPKDALEQLRSYLQWRLDKDSAGAGSDFADVTLHKMNVPVRPEYKVGDRIYASDEPLTLPVHYAAGKLTTGLLVAALPLIGVRFYYHEPDNLKSLVTRYAQQALKGLTPRELARHLPPPEVTLEEIVIRTKVKVRHQEYNPALPALTAVAEPLGERAVRKQFSRAWEREAQVAEAVRKLHNERTNLLLVGEVGSGKTTVLVEAVQKVEQLRREEAEARGESGRHEKLFWLTSGGRMIAGMKYLGQWEARCEQVIEELARLEGVLCVDRLLDLVRVGGCGPTDSVAAFLMSYLQRGELHLAAEATLAELDACRRLLPGFADLLPVVHLPPFERHQAVNVLDRALERHTQEQKLTAEAGVSDRVYQLLKRFMPYTAFPGTAVGLVRDLCEHQARNAPEQALTPDSVVRQVTRRTGLPDWLLRDEVPLGREKLLADLRRQVIGQEEAVEAAAQLVINLKAGLNDPRRPVGVLLFCGPTGVGKTELARALARTFFGHGEADPALPREDRLLRLDMSEYASFDAVHRLVGPPDSEPSPFVRRMRQQPFSVVLFDEIEKAGPEVFDVLLSVCDEGRLTDRYGRTTTFCSSVIIMTSNLGASQKEGFGLLPAPPSRFAEAAREFFRPEFFNRLDGVVTFRPLSRETIEAITRKELDAVAAREGFERSGIRLRWSDRLVGWLAKTGFDMRYGARPLQRVIERQVVAPLAKYLLTNGDLGDAVLEVDGADGAIEIRRAG